MERRRRYRVRIDRAEPIQATLAVPGCPEEQVRLRDASSEGARVELSAELPLSIPTGQGVDLTVWLLDGRRAVELPATVVDEYRVNGLRRVGLRFASEEQVRRELGGEMGRLFNRRTTPRVSPDAPVPVRIRPADGASPPTEAAVRDFSEGGIGLHLSTDQEPELGCHSPFDLSFELPPCARRIHVRSRLRYRRLSGGRVTWGLAFEGDEGSMLRAHQGAIDAYVAAHQV